MATRYFLDKAGAKTFRLKGLPGEGHFEIAQEVLSRHGVAPADYASHYHEMFRLRYSRVVEHDGHLLEVEYRRALTPGQKRYVGAMRAAGWMVQLVEVDRPTMAPASDARPKP